MSNFHDPSLTGTPVLPGPTEHVAGRGPIQFDIMIERLDRIAALQEKLTIEARWPRYELRERAERAFQLDANGDAVQLLYQVPPGMIFSLTRVVATHEGFTAASPYTNAAAWMGLFAGRPDASGRGRLIDFAPTVSGAQLFPAVAEYNSADTGPLVQSGEQLYVLVESGTASRMVSIILQGVLREQ